MISLKVVIEAKYSWVELNASLSLEISDVSSILHSLESGLSKLGVVLFKEVFS